MSKLWKTRGREETEAVRRGGTDEQPLSDKLPLVSCGETYSTCQQ